jgi:hypothetical protein
MIFPAASGVYSAVSLFYFRPLYVAPVCCISFLLPATVPAPVYGSSKQKLLSVDLLVYISLPALAPISSFYAASSIIVGFHCCLSSIEPPIFCDFFVSQGCHISSEILAFFEPTIATVNFLLRCVTKSRVPSLL